VSIRVELSEEELILNALARVKHPRGERDVVARGQRECEAIRAILAPLRAQLAAAEARADAAERERDAALAGARENADWAGAAEAAMKAAEARADAAERRADAAEKAEPMQPIVVAADGMIRFRENKLVRWLLDAGGLDMNDLARFAIEADVPQRDREQFAQLIGYSISGYSELSYVSDESYNRAEEMAGPLHAALASGEGETATRTGDPRPDGSGQG